MQHYHHSLLFSNIFLIFDKKYLIFDKKYLIQILWLVKAQGFTWIIHNFRLIKMGDPWPCLVCPLQLDVSKGRKQVSYFLKTFFTGESELKYKVHSPGRSQKENISMLLFLKLGWKMSEVSWCHRSWLSSPHPFVWFCICVCLYILHEYVWRRVRYKRECDSLIWPSLLLHTVSASLHALPTPSLLHSSPVRLNGQSCRLMLCRPDQWVTGRHSVQLLPSLQPERISCC